MKVVIGILSALAAIAWAVAVVTAVRLSRQLSGRLSLGAMAVRGTAWFDARNFAPGAAGLVHVFKRAFAGFFVCVLLIAVAAIFAVERP